MKKTNILGVFLFLFFSVIFSVGVAKGEDNDDGRRVYIVYMGSVPSNAQTATVDPFEEEHLQLLASVVKSEDHRKRAILRRYKNGFSGFAALLSEEEALAIGENPRVVSVFADPLFQLHTTRSWDFLNLQSMVAIESIPILSVNSRNRSSSDTIIGVLDTGIWPESESFNDKNMDAVPARWKGTCEKADDFDTSNCNRKLIGMRSYSNEPGATRPSLGLSPRDQIGHGTHTASTAAGNPVQGASYYGLATGTAKGGSTTARIAVYKICESNGCPGSSIMAAFDDAVADGVDILSLSLGASILSRPNFFNDPIAIGALHAVVSGITVVCSSGNDGPRPGTTVNAAPWILTVAATTIDRDFESNIVLGGNDRPLKGKAINFSKLNKTAIYPLIYGGSAAIPGADESTSSCDPGSLDQDKIKGKIIFCLNSERGLTINQKAEGLKSLGVIGAVFADDTSSIAMTYASFPVTVVSSQSGTEILSYINSTKNPVATILPTTTVGNLRPAPAVAKFSSRGPSFQTRNILKPDISAPGVNILAAWPPLNNSNVVPPGEKPTSFNLVSGTSMACPHVTAIAATIKSLHPEWSPAAIRSAIMTTATQNNTAKDPIMTDLGVAATPYDYGSGEINPLPALKPGLVYDIEPEDYLQFLCNYGYNISMISLISPLPDGFACNKNSKVELISDLNYPSIAVAMNGKKNWTVTRTVRNVEGEEAIYRAIISSPDGLEVKVDPSELHFTKKNDKLSYQVTFTYSLAASPKEDLFGSITWSNEKHTVKSVFVVGNYTSNRDLMNVKEYQRKRF